MSQGRRAVERIAAPNGFLRKGSSGLRIWVLWPCHCGSDRCKLSAGELSVAG
jgi:hypothetical protein